MLNLERFKVLGAFLGMKPDQKYDQKEPFSGRSENASKYIFVCRANIERSPLCAELFSDLLKDYGKSGEVYSAGFDADPEYAIHRTVIKLTPEMINDARFVFVMEPWMKKKVIDELGLEPDRVVCLNFYDSRKTPKKGAIFMQDVMEDTESKNILKKRLSKYANH